MFPVDLIGDGAAVPVGAGPIEKALLDQAAGQAVEFRNAARARNPAAGNPAAGTDGEGHENAAANTLVAKVPWIIGRGDGTGDLFEVASTVAIAIAFTALTAAGPAPGCRASPRSAARNRGVGANGHDGHGCGIDMRGLGSR